MLRRWPETPGLTHYSCLGFQSSWGWRAHCARLPLHSVQSQRENFTVYPSYSLSILAFFSSLLDLPASSLICYVYFEYLRFFVLFCGTRNWTQGSSDWTIPPALLILILITILLPQSPSMLRLQAHITAPTIVWIFKFSNGQCVSCSVLCNLVTLKGVLFSHWSFWFLLYLRFQQFYFLWR